MNERCYLCRKDTPLHLHICGSCVDKAKAEITKPKYPCDCQREAANMIAHDREVHIKMACSCLDHPIHEWCDCPFCLLLRSVLTQGRKNND